MITTLPLIATVAVLPDNNTGTDNSSAVYNSTLVFVSETILYCRYVLVMGIC